MLRLEDDEYYGSDFIRMAAILQETEKNKPGMADIFCNWSRLKDKSPLSSDAELECSNDMDDGSTWAEGPLRNPKLEHIIVCHALHALCTHMNWSILWCLVCPGSLTALDGNGIIIYAHEAAFH